MLVDFEQAKALINNSQRILLTMHERMDGDDGGSVLALAHQLKTLGKNVTCTIKKGVPQQLRFLPGSNEIIDDIEPGKIFDLLITCGCANIERTGSQNIPQLSCPILNIDHHPDNKHFGMVNMVDAKKSSVAELVYEFFIFCEWNVTKEIATCLLTGIITDTGSFMHSNTQPSTLETAAALMRKGALTDTIIQHTFRKQNPESLRAWGKAIENSYYDPEHKIIFSVMTEDDLAEFENLPQAAFEGLVETLNTVPEAQFAMFLRQEGDTIKGSLRSDTFKKVDVSKIAKLFGGGGHTQAAGFSVVGKLQKDNEGKWKVE